ncbi:hypothetical protein ScPMuIL_002545 [Solemya velum]
MMKYKTDGFFLEAGAAGVNRRVSRNLRKIQRASQSGNLDSIQETCQNAQEELHKQNKFIKLADKSPAGWDTVNEYLSDKLASDSEDEKRMRCAENRALRARSCEDNPTTQDESKCRGNQLLLLSAILLPLLLLPVLLQMIHFVASGNILRNPPISVLPVSSLAIGGD